MVSSARMNVTTAQPVGDYQPPVGVTSNPNHLYPGLAGYVNRIQVYLWR